MGSSRTLRGVNTGDSTNSGRENGRNVGAVTEVMWIFKSSMVSPNLQLSGMNFAGGGGGNRRIGKSMTRTNRGRRDFQRWRPVEVFLHGKLFYTVIGSTVILNVWRN